MRPDGRADSAEDGAIADGREGAEAPGLPSDTVGAAACCCTGGCIRATGERQAGPGAKDHISDNGPLAGSLGETIVGAGALRFGMLWLSTILVRGCQCRVAPLRFLNLPKFTRGDTRRWILGLALHSRRLPCCSELIDKERRRERPGLATSLRDTPACGRRILPSLPLPDARRSCPVHWRTARWVLPRILKRTHGGHMTRSSRSLVGSALRV